MAIAEKRLAAEFNMPDMPKIIDHFTYVICDFSNSTPSRRFAEEVH